MLVRAEPAIYEFPARGTGRLFPAARNGSIVGFQALPSCDNKLRSPQKRAGSASTASHDALSQTESRICNAIQENGNELDRQRDCRQPQKLSEA